MTRIRFQDNLTIEALAELERSIRELDAAYDEALEHVSLLMNEDEPDDECGECDEHEGPDFRVRADWLGMD